MNGFIKATVAGLCLGTGLTAVGGYQYADATVTRFDQNPALDVAPSPHR